MTNLEIYKNAESFTVAPTEETISYLTEKFKEITGKDLFSAKSWIEQNYFDDEGQMTLELKSYETLSGHTDWIYLDIDTDFIFELA